MAGTKECVRRRTSKPRSIGEDAELSLPTSQIPGRVACDGHPASAQMSVPSEFEIVLNAPIGPQRLRDDTIVIDEDGWYRTLTPSSSWPASNEVLFSNLNERDPDGEIDAIVSEYHRLGLPLTWCVYPWTQPGDLGERLRARGATQSVIQAFLGSTALALEVVDGVEIEQIDPESKEAYEAYINIMVSCYSLPADEEAFRHRRYHQLSTGSAPRMRLFIGRYEGAAVGCAAMIIKENSAHFTGDCILPAFQARGIFQSLIAARLQVLRDMGIAMATGHSNEQSAFWAKRFGFKSIYTYNIYQLDPPATVG